MLEQYEATRELSVDSVDVLLMRDLADEFLNGYRLHENDEEELTRRLKQFVRTYIIAAFEQNRITLPVERRLVFMSVEEALNEAKANDGYDARQSDYTVTEVQLSN